MAPQVQKPNNPVIIPNMLDEIGLLCLARLPPPTTAIARCVCRSWRNALANPSALRRSLKIPPPLTPYRCVFLAIFDTECDPGYLRATNHNTQWLLLHCNPSFSIISLPNPLSQISTRAHLKSAAADGTLFLPDIPLTVNHETLGFQSYRVEEQRWSTIPSLPPPYKHVTLYACAAVGDFVYFSGGQNDVTGAATKTACRYDTVKNRWEILPDMIMPRIDCTGVVKDGKFVAIGGCYRERGFAQVHDSGEVYDPASRRWTLLPNLWGAGLNYVDESNAAQPAVGVVGHTIYALQSHSNELMRFDPVKQLWSGVGFVGGACERNFSLRYKVMAVGEEIWVISYAMGRDIRIHACKFLPQKHPLSGHVIEKLICREIKVPELQGFDHVLTCTVFTL